MGILPLSESEKTGLAFEMEVFGIASSGLRPWSSYMPFGLALQDAYNHQPAHWDPTTPTTRIGRKMYEAVARHLPEEVRPMLRFYVAVGRSLDECHSIDGFFIVDGWRKSFVGIDLVAHRRKNRTCKFNRNGILIFPRHHVIGKSEAEIEQTFDEVGKLIAEKLLTRRRRQGTRNQFVAYTARK